MTVTSHFVFTSDSANTSADSAYLINGATNKRPNDLLFVTPNFTPGGLCPCLYEPEIGSLFPNNWIRPRFRLTATAGQNLFQIKLQIPHEKSPLFIYTTSSTWTMDQATWQILSTVGADGFSR